MIDSNKNILLNKAIPKSIVREPSLRGPQGVVPKLLSLEYYFENYWIVHCMHDSKSVLFDEIISAEQNL